ncbi:MAG: glycogen debranching protein GlgX [Verrucomicrobiota bacterium]
MRSPSLQDLAAVEGPAPEKAFPAIANGASVASTAAPSAATMSTAAAPSLPDYVARLCETAEVRIGRPFPFGVEEYGGGVNFALFSRHATRVRLEFFDRPEDGRPARVLELDPLRNRTGDVWHIWVQGVRRGQLYAYRVGGDYAPREGLRYNFNKLLLDPCAIAITQRSYWDFGAACGYDPSAPESDLAPSIFDDAAAMPKCIFTGGRFDWDGDRRLRHPWSQTVIYEAHVRGFTIHPNSGVPHPGTYRGLIEKIPYLKELGVTAIELMPVQEFNEHQVKSFDPATGRALGNYWGYDPVVFAAPKASYCSAGGLGHQKLEFQEMVKAFHAAGIEVILDIVLNHTAEGDVHGPMLSYRGIDNPIYYTLREDKRYYRDYTGTGNSINAPHPVVRDHLLSSLCTWVTEMHVDGFRFDLAAVLGRDNRGNVVHDSPLLERIAEDPILRESKLIAEAWDAAGAYEVGSFSDSRWAEWNGRYRDDVRRFWRGDAGLLGPFASRLAGSSDIYRASGKGPECSINFITSHDGFTLNDLVSYRDKHNEGNGEANRDGSNDNYSDNHGIEGPTESERIELARRRQIKNFLLTLLVSRGVPMLLAGDEFRRTQRGNNNAYCQDNEISWIDWRNLEQHREIFLFARDMIAFRQGHPVLHREKFYTPEELVWFNASGATPNWHDPNARHLGALMHERDDAALFLIFNADSDGLRFALPAPPRETSWRLAVDTSLPHSEESMGHRLPLKDPHSYEVGGQSSVILEARVWES